MVAQNQSMSLGSMLEETVENLFGREIMELAKDGFESFWEEEMIYSKVFFENCISNGRNSCDVFGTMKFQLDEGSKLITLGNYNCESSVPANVSSTKRSSRETLKHTKTSLREIGGSGYFVDRSSSWAGSDAQKTNVKRLKLSPVENLSYKDKGTGQKLDDTCNVSMHLGTSNVIPSIFLSNSSDVCQQVPCRIVESFGQGFISSYHMIDVQGNLNGFDINGDPKCKSKTGNDKVFAKAKSDNTTGSQQSCTLKILESGKHVVLGKRPLARLCINQQAEESNILNSEMVSAAKKVAFMRDLPSRLRSHAHHLLMEAGWEIEVRKRKDGTKVDFIYKLPEEGPCLYSLPKAWVSCGKVLSAGTWALEEDENGRQWVTINEFWFDLADTLGQIEKGIQQPGKVLSLLDRWKILDPFMAVICIDKKIRALREGNALKAVNSATVMLTGNAHMILAEKGVGRVQDNLGKPDSHLLCRSKRSLLPNPMPADKSKVQEGLCIQQVSVTQSCHVLRNKHKYRRAKHKPCCGADVQNRSLRTITKHIGKGFHDSKGFHGISSEAASIHNKTNQLCSNRKSSQRKSCISVPISFAENILLCKKINSAESKTQAPHSPRSAEDACLNKSVDSSAEEGGLSLSHVGKLLVGNQPCGETTIDKQMPVVKHREKSAYQGRDGVCTKVELAHEDTWDSFVKKVDQQEKLGSSVFLGGSVRKRFSWEESDRNGGALDCPTICEKICTSVQEKKLHGVTQNKNSSEDSWSLLTQKAKKSSGDSGNLFIVNRASQHPMPEQQVLYLYPQEGTPCFSMDDRCRQQLFTCVSMPEAMERINMQQQMQSSVYQLSLTGGHFRFGLDGSTAQNVNIPIQCVELNPAPKQSPSLAEKVVQTICVKDSEFHKEDNARSSGTSDSQMRQTSASVSIEMAGNKSKKISEVEAVKVTDINVGAKPTNRNCIELLGLDIDGKVQNHLFPVNQIENSVLRLESTSECLKNSDCLEKQCGDTSKIGVGHTPAVLEDGSAKKIYKKPPKSEIKAGRQNNKDKKFDPMMSLEDESGGILSKVKTDNKIAGVQSTTCKDNAVEASSEMSTSIMLSHSTYGESVELMNMLDNNKLPSEHFGEEKSDEDLRFANGESTDVGDNQGVIKAKKSEVRRENGHKRWRVSQVDDDDDLLMAIIINKYYRSSSRNSASKARLLKSNALRKFKSRKGGHKLLPQTAGKGGKHFADGKRLFLGARTVFCRLIEMGVISINNVIQYRNPKNNTVVKDGRVTRDGILCKCCGKILSVSDFKFHSGFKLRRPSLNLFMGSGKPYTLCQLQAWSIEYKSRKDNMQTMEAVELDESDDSCVLCGDGGELICCDNCPSTYHQACLPSQELPEGSWYCPNCSCEICGDVVNAMENSNTVAALECSLCECRYHTKCIKEMITYKGEVESDAWFCRQSCQQVHVGLRSRVGVTNCLDNGFSWMILRCSHGDHKVQSAQKIALMAECNIKLAIALTIMEECFLPMVDPRTGIDIIPHVLYNRGSDSARLNHKGFYTVVLEKNDELISVACIRVHGVMVAEMPLIATCTEHRRQGMCRRLVGVIEEVFSFFLRS
uniref:Increased DNA methylation 1-like n=1 Tax=Elaeis guineensis var. tenera TaxID=51953 RepID=A0A6J0PMK9_ELAGV|nr:increased DNA methylation 1-like [Elaeis guineensis]